MSHGRILCVSLTENNGTCEENYDLVNIIDADYIGDNMPNDTEAFIGSQFEGAFDWFPNNKEVDDENTCQGYLQVNDKSKKIYLKMLSRMRRKFEKTTDEEIWNTNVDYFTFLSGWTIRYSDYLVYFDDRILTVPAFISEATRYYSLNKLYVNGCVDFHV